ncbi:MAG: tyrosine--tRNA ligase [Microthrixaceae bacterium]
MTSPGRVGDPTGRNEVRRVLDGEQTLANAATYLDQVRTILRDDRLEVRHNSEWLATMDFSEILRYSRLVTVARLLERDDFAKRYKAGRPISLMEFMYPLMQGLDSVFVDSDVELGGTDQTYNNLMGRQLQSALGKPAQIVMTVPLLRGTDGAEKMGKSLGNYIAIGDPPDEQYGKILSISDDLVEEYAALCCGWSAAELEASGSLVQTDPFAAKRAVAHRVVELYHGSEAADAAAEAFDRRFRRREIDTGSVPAFTMRSAMSTDGHPSVVDVLVASGLCASRGEARRMIASGAVRLDGTRVEADGPLDPESVAGSVLQRGKRHAVRLEP